MCTSKPKTPAVVVRDPVAEAKQADATAQAAANVETANRRKRLKGQSLFTVGARGLPGRGSGGGSAYSAFSASQAATKQTLGG